jgi:choline dehydrogenase-like flavoprotein
LASTWRYENGEEFQPQIHYCVGGPTKLYGAALYPLRKEDFGELRHHDGVSPAWPIAYDELEPYYTLAEQLYCVHGARGEDPTEPSLIERSVTFRQGEALIAGKISPRPALLRFAARITEEGGADVPATWAAAR